MKKIFSVLLSIFICGSVFAEIGFGGNRWKDSIEEVKGITYKNGIVDSKIYSTEEYTKEIEILGQKIEESFIFSVRKGVSFQTKKTITVSELYGVCFSIDKNKTSDIKKLFKNQIDILKYNEKNDDPDCKEFEYVDGTEPLFKNYFVLVENADCSYTTKYGHFDSVKQTADDGIYITIYDYNDDTNVYIFENLIKDISIVLYAPKYKEE